MRGGTFAGLALAVLSAAIVMALVVFRNPTAGNPLWITDNISAASILRVGVTAEWAVDQMADERPPWSPVRLERAPAGSTPLFVLETANEGGAINAILPLVPAVQSPGTTPFYAWVFFPTQESPETQPTIAFFDAANDTVIAMQSVTCAVARDALALGEMSPPQGAGCFPAAST